MCTHSYYKWYFSKPFVLTTTQNLNRDTIVRKKQLQKMCTVFVLALTLAAFVGCGGGGGGSSSSKQKSPTYSVGGTVQGLVGTGLVLQNNATDDLAVSDNGSFQFSSKILDQTDFTVTVLSQPASPDQVCHVVNGDQTVGGANITDVQVVCTYGFQESFDSEISSGYWNSSAQYSRELNGGELECNLVTTSEYAINYLPFKDTTCGSIALDLTITNTSLSGTGTAVYSSRLETCGYHSTTVGEAAGSKTGDVRAAIVVEGTTTPFQAYYQVFRCLNDTCSDNQSVEFLTTGDDGLVLLGDVDQNTPATIGVEWDDVAEEFSFQLDSVSATFDPVVAGAPVAAAANATEKYFGLRTDLTNPDDTADVTATFDNVEVNGALYDDFDPPMTYLDGSLWNRASGKVAIDTGRLTLETVKQWVNDLSVDNAFHSTELVSNDIVFPNAEIVEADVSMDSSTVVVNTLGSPAEVYAAVEMIFRPLDNANKDFTDEFSIQAALKEDSGGLTATVRAIGCTDSSCMSKHLDQTQAFTTIPVTDTQYHFKMEHDGNGSIAVILDNSETLTVDLSTIPEFAQTEFRRIQLRTLARGTDASGEEAFVKAYFDNIVLGTP